MRLRLRMHAWIGCGLIAMNLMAVALADDQPPTGWRGNWTGLYPGADVPTQWIKTSPELARLTVHADRPEDGKPLGGASARNGAITQWLVLGPVSGGAVSSSAASSTPASDRSASGPAASGGPIDDDLIDEANIQPHEGLKTGGQTWKKIAVPGHYVDFLSLYGGHTRSVAYAHAYLYSPNGGKVALWFKNRGAIRIFLNGKPVSTKGLAVLDLAKGVNRLLVKVATSDGPVDPVYNVFWPSAWHMAVMLQPMPGSLTKLDGIAWQTRMPSWSGSTPVIVGERIYCASEPHDLVCLDRATGRILWVRTITYYDTLSDEQRKAEPYAALAAEIKKVADVNAAYDNGKSPTAEQLAAKAAGVKKLNKALGDVDAEKYKIESGILHAGLGIATPCTDGKDVFMYWAFGLAARLDEKGAIVWASRHDTGKAREHGYTSSPILLEGKLVTYRKDAFGWDAQTGKLLWTLDIAADNYLDNTCTTPILLNLGGKKYLFMHGQIFDSDGKRLSGLDKKKVQVNEITTPLVDVDGTIFLATTFGDVIKLAPTKDPTVAPELLIQKRIFARNLGVYGRTMTCSSVLLHEGLLYIVDIGGVLHVLDAKDLNLVYKQDLGLGFEAGNYVYPMGLSLASPILAGTYIYVPGASGTTVVIEPGRQYKEVARNKIDEFSLRGRPEGFVASPLTDGKRLYLRGEEYLYCVGK